MSRPADPYNSDAGQPAEPNDDLACDLAEFEDSLQAKQVERIADASIVKHLATVGFNPDSYEWRQLFRALVEYGVAVLAAWAATGALHYHAARQGVRGAARIPPDLRLKSDDAQNLALDVTIVAVEAFRTKSLRRWRPSGGASLKTYFIGRCLMELPDVLKVWDAKERKPLPPAPYVVVDDGRHSPRPSEEAEARVILDDLFDGDPVLYKAFVMQEAGYSLDEIVQALNAPDAPLTLGSLRTRMHRFRLRAKKWNGHV